MARGRDVICARGGDDVVFALNGNDVILGGPGDDELHGQAGNDQLIGDAGDDALDGGNGQNSCEAGAPAPGPNLCVGYFTIERFTLSRHRLNTEQAQKDLRVTVEISNTQPDARAIRDIELNPVNERKGAGGGFGRLRLESGDAIHGTWSGPLTVPQRTPRGSYDVGLYLHETVIQTNPGGATHPVDGSRLRRAGFDNSFDQVGAGDNAPPELRWFEFLSRTVDTSQEAVTVAVQMRIVDDTGFTGGIWRIQTPSGTALGNVFGMGLESGNDRDGIYRGDFRLLRNAAPGRYRLLQMSLADRFTQVDLRQPDLRRLGIDPTFDQIGPGDSTRPSLEQLEVDPQRVDVSGGGQATVNVHLRATDDLTGIEEWTLDMRRSQDAYPLGGAGGTHAGFGFHDSPTTVDESQATQFPFPGAGTAPRGDYEFTLTVRDAAGNQSVYSSADLAALGFPSVLHNGT